jgi:nodulation protein E
LADGDRRVVVTALGVTSAFGVGWQSLAEGLTSGRTTFAALEGLLGQVPPGRGALLDLPRKEYKIWFDPRTLRPSTMTRQTTLGCVACGALLQDAGQVPDGTLRADRGAYLGSFIVPPPFKKQFQSVRLLTHRPEGQATGYVLDDAKLAIAMKKASAFDFLRALPNRPSSHLSIQAGFQGPGCTYLGSDASGMQAMVMAVGAIQSGIADGMIAGGAFCPFQEVHLAWQGQRGMWSQDGTVRPFAVGRTGTLPGEGAALMYFEEVESAKARGAPILAEVIGFGQRIGLPGGAEEVDVRVDTLRAAFGAGTPDWIGIDGLGQGDLDRLEAQAWVEAFGADGLGTVAAVSTVPQIGFAGPATGPLNLVAALLAARGDTTPSRTSHDAGSDAACSVLAEAMGRTGRTGAGTVVLGSTFSFDGVHAAIALKVTDGS